MEGQDLLGNVYYGKELKTLEEIEEIFDKALLISGEYTRERKINLFKEKFWGTEVQPKP